MKKIILLLIVSMVLSGCVYRWTPSRYYETNNYPNLREVDLGTGNMKRGRACQTRILFFIPLSSDTGIVRAAQLGKIRKIMLEERSVEDYILWSRVCTEVYGE